MKVSGVYPISEIRPTAAPVTVFGTRVCSNSAKYRPLNAYTPKYVITRLVYTIASTSGLAPMRSKMAQQPARAPNAIQTKRAIPNLAGAYWERG